MPTRITSALETKPDIPHGSATLVRPHAKPLPRGCSIWNFKHSVAEASAADENSVVSLDGSKHATVNPVGLNKRLPVEPIEEMSSISAKTESHSYRPRFARVQRHSSVGRRQLDRAM